MKITEMVTVGEAIQPAVNKICSRFKINEEELEKILKDADVNVQPISGRQSIDTYLLEIVFHIDGEVER